MKPYQQLLQDVPVFLIRHIAIKSLSLLFISGTLTLSCTPDSSQQVFSALPDSIITERASAAEALLHQWTQAYIDGDTAALNRIIADDWVYTNGGGKTTTKKQAISSFITSGEKYESIDYDDLKVRIYDRAAIVTGNETMRIRKQNGGDAVYRLRFTDVYYLDNNQWRAIATHTSPL